MDGSASKKKAGSAKSEPAKDDATLTQGLATRKRQVREMRFGLAIYKADRRLREILKAEGDFGQDHEVTEERRQIVFRYKGLGMEDAEIAYSMGLPLGALRDLYSRELGLARPQYNLDMAMTVYEIGRNPKHPKAFEAAKLWLELHGGADWQPTTRVQVDDKRGGKPAGAGLIDSSKLDAGEREELRALLLKATAPDALPQSGPIVAEQ